jgi:hypothetical protein
MLLSTHLTIGGNYDKNIEIPDSVTHLVFIRYYNKLTSIHDSVTHLFMGGFYDSDLVIPNSVKFLMFGLYFDQKCVIPNSVVQMTLGYIGKNYEDVPIGGVSSPLCLYLNEPIIINECIKILMCGFNFYYDKYISVSQATHTIYINQKS